MDLAKMANMHKRMTATEAKNNFGGLLEAVATFGAVEIVKHGRPVAVVLSPRSFEAAARRPHSAPDGAWGETHMIPASRARAARMIRTPRAFGD
jgi:prevent-host-death family protein